LDKSFKHASSRAKEYSFAFGRVSYCDPIATIAPAIKGLGLVAKKVGR
jgi:hypothetical protein